MNPLHWEAPRRPQHHPAAVDNSSGPLAWMKTHGSTYSYPVEEARSGTGTGVGPQGPGFRDHQHRVNAELEDPDGEPLEEDEDDPELARKRQELNDIQDQILQKRVSIALRTVEKLETPYSNQANSLKMFTLRGRVNEILRLRRSLGISKPLRKRAHPSALSDDDVQVDDHPLKRRVKALMKRRCSDFPSNSQIEDAPCAPPPPCPSVSAPAHKDHVNQGFQRFLTLLNKGIDLDLLSRIVTDDSEELPPDDALLKHAPSAFMPRGDTRQHARGAPQQEGSGKREADLASQEPACSNGKSPSHDEAKTDDSGNGSLGSSRRSKSPLALEKKSTKIGGEKPKDDQHQTLQNILNTLGLSLEAEEMSKLTDRTQERLYGRRDGRATGELETPTTMASIRHHRSSSSSSSLCSSPSSSSSRSLSRSPSPSLSRGPHSQESGDVQTSQGGSHYVRQAEHHVEGEGTNFGENFAYQDPHCHPAAASSFPGYSQNSYGAGHAAYVNGTYGATHWEYPQGDSSASPGPDSYPYSYQQPPAGAYRRFDTDSRLFGDLNLLINPDLSQSEGQSGSLYRTCCLLPVNSGRASDRDTIRKTLTHSKKRKKKKRQKRWEKCKKKVEVKLEKVTETRCKAPAQKVEEPPAQQELTERKQELTEEEIKANLRKKLEAFNKMAKNKSQNQPNPTH